MSDKKILISGCAGYIGRNLCKTLSECGHHVYGLVRSRDNFESVIRHGGNPVLSPPIECSDAARCFQDDVDVVIHLAAHVHKRGRQARSDEKAFNAVNVVGSENMARLALRCNASHFLVFSTIAVYGDRSTEGPVRVSSETRPLTPYARSKLDGEEIVLRTLRDSEIDTKVVRIPMVYGREAPGNFSRLCKLVASGIPLPLGCATSKRSLLYVHNLGSAIASIVASPDRCPTISLIADDTALPIVSVVETLARAMGRSSRVFAIPKPTLRFASRLIGQQTSYTSLFEPMEIDTDEFRTAMNWSAPFEISDALLQSASVSG